ncbi:MAG: MarR family transcriptional regulator [Bacteroidales bacterium]|nr:MarR family transcriptional regulator [Bacteroidales bacterium]MCF8457541.1 MarR family transcriptional regulator [Bacteroidales bacterium]
MEATKQISDIHRKMIVHIMHTGQLLESKISSMLKQFDITHVQFNILKVLEASHPQPLCVGEVKQGVLFSNSDITRIIDRLVHKNLVERELCPNNRRKMDIKMSADGFALLAQIAPKLAEVFDNCYENEVSEMEAQKMINILKRIKNK